MDAHRVPAPPWLLCAALTGACTLEPWWYVDVDIDPPPPGDSQGVDIDGATSSTDGSGSSGVLEPGADADGDGVAAPEDCDDGDAQVYPGQVSFFTAPSAAGSFDYDCSGGAELEFAAHTTCDPPTCGDVAGWRHPAPIPGCGALGEWDSGYCQVEADPEHPPYCSGGAPPTPRLQGCR